MNMDEQQLEPRPLFDRQGLDIVALIWMVSTAAFVGVEIYSALHLFGGIGGRAFGTWDKIAALGQTGGPTVAVSCLIGIALAALLDSPAARIAIFLSGVTGAWVLVAGCFNVAAALHRNNSAYSVVIGFGRGNRAVGVIGGLALAGLGLVVLMLAFRAYNRAVTRVSPPQQTLR
jgi:hypothetical protein